MARALALEESLALPPAMWSQKLLLCDQLFWSHDLIGAQRLAEELRDAARRADGLLEGDQTGLAPVSAAGSSFVSEALAEPEPVFYLALIEWRAGNWRRAAELAEEARAPDEQSGRDGLAAVVEWPRTLIAAHRGLVDEARERARKALAQAESAGIEAAVAGYRWVLGFLELSEGDPAAALAHLRAARRAREMGGHDEPGQMWELPDLLEALVAMGELDEAEAIAAAAEERARSLDRAWALALSARTRAVVAAVRGNLDGAFAAFEEALAEHARTRDPFQHARTLLALGTTQRRAKRRGDARTTLEQALAGFEQLGAPLWAEKTRAELARIGGRAPRGARSPRASAASPRSSPRGARTARSPRRSSSPSTRSRPRSRAYTENWASARGPNWRAGCPATNRTRGEQTPEVFSFRGGAPSGTL